METGWVVAIGVIALILGGCMGGAVFSTETKVEVEKIVEVPAECEEVVCEPVDCTYSDSSSSGDLDTAVNDFMKAVEDEEDEAGNDMDILDDMNYNFDEVELKKVYDEYTVEADGDKKVVTFKVKLRFDEDDERSEYEKYDVQVTYEDGEDTEVELL